MPVDASLASMTTPVKSPGANLLDPAVLARISNLELRARAVVEGDRLFGDLVTRVADYGPVVEITTEIRGRRDFTSDRMVEVEA